MIKSKKKDAIVIGFLTLFIYIVSTSPQLKPISIYLLTILIIASVVIFTYKKRRGLQRIYGLELREIFFYIALAALLLIIGITGWFYSPFFYLLYLLGAYLSFARSLLSTVVFISILSLVFIPNIGNIDTFFDLITLLSLLIVIPISYYIHKNYNLTPLSKTPGR